MSDKILNRLYDSPLYYFRIVRTITGIFTNVYGYIQQHGNKIAKLRMDLDELAVLAVSQQSKIDELSELISELSSNKAETTQAPQKNFTTASDIMDRHYRAYEDSNKPATE